MALLQEEIGNYQAFSRLLSILRLNSKNNQPSALAVECLLHVAIKPRTYEELVMLTNTQNQVISRAVLSMVPHVKRTSSKDEIVQPSMHLLNRERRRAPLKGYRVSLSKGGELLFIQAGLSI